MEEIFNRVATISSFLEEWLNYAKEWQRCLVSLILWQREFPKVAPNLPRLQAKKIDQIGIGLNYWKDTAKSLDEDNKNLIKDCNLYLNDAAKVAKECQNPAFKVDDIFVSQAAPTTQLSNTKS